MKNNILARNLQSTIIKRKNEKNYFIFNTKYF